MLTSTAPGSHLTVAALSQRTFKQIRVLQVGMDLQIRHYFLLPITTFIELKSIPAGRRFAQELRHRPLDCSVRLPIPQEDLQGVGWSAYSHVIPSSAFVEPRGVQVSQQRHGHGVFVIHCK
jgi:hypothetical protein